MTDKQTILDMPVFIVLARMPQENAYRGLIERSFSMDWDKDRVNMFWTGTAYSFLGTHSIDGKEDAEHMCKIYSERFPEWEIKVYDAKDKNCPVEIEWEAWAEAMLACSKFNSRNAKFSIKDIV